MYNFIYWFFYKLFEWRNNEKSTFMPTIAVVLAFIIHFFLFYSFFRLLTHSNPLSWGEDLTYGERKYLMLPIVLVMFFGVWYFYYRKRSEYIVSSYQFKKPFTFENIALVFLIIVIPLIVSIRITNALIIH